MKKIIFISLLLVQVYISYSQNNFSTVQKSAKDGSIELAIFAQPTNIESNRLLKLINNADELTTWQLTTSIKDGNIVHEHYQQYYNGLFVHGADYAVHKTNGNTTMLNGKFAPVIDKTQLSFALSEMEVKKIALNIIASKVKTNKEIQITSIVKMYSLNDFDKTQTMQAAYAVITNHHIYSTIIISAQTGTVLAIGSSICTDNVPGVGDTHYSGNRNFIADHNITAGNFRLRENRSGVNLAVLNMASVIDFENTSAATDFIDNDNNWTRAEHGNDDIAVEVKWSMQFVLDYWRTTRNRNSYNNSGAPVNCYIHSPFSLDNAAWNGRNNTLNFCDGNLAGPHASLDVVAHEFAHGVFQTSIGIVQNSFSEVGALNEGLSDIWGAAVKNFSSTGKRLTLILWGLSKKFMQPKQEKRDIYHTSLISPE